MSENITFIELLEIIADCSGDEAIGLVVKFQSGELTIEGVGVEDFG